MLKLTVRTDGIESLKARMNSACSEAEEFVAKTVKDDTEPYVPMLTGNFRKRTVIVGKYIIYPPPFARYLWEGFQMVDSDTGRPAFYIEHVGFRFRKDAKLKKTSKKLVYTTTSPIQAGDHWFDKSKAQNLEKWIKTADKAVIHYLKRK